jgi:acetylornithine/LysW-gamma-L-lysine aminotransferase
MRFDVRDLLLDAINEGLLMLYSGRNVIRLLPPLVMDEATVSKAVNIIDKVISAEEKRRDVH